MEPIKLFGKTAAEIKEGQTFTATKTSVEGRIVAILTLVEDED